MELDDHTNALEAMYAQNKHDRKAFKAAVRQHFGEWAMDHWQAWMTALERNGGKVAKWFRDMLEKLINHFGSRQNRAVTESSAENDYLSENPVAPDFTTWVEGQPKDSPIVFQSGDKTMTVKPDASSKGKWLVEVREGSEVTSTVTQDSRDRAAALAAAPLPAGACTASRFRVRTRRGSGPYCSHRSEETSPTSK